jgi:membrane-associated phospholipid phosphatase
MIDQPTTLLVAIVSWTIVATMVALRAAGLTFPLADLTQPVLCCLGLTVAAWWYRRTPSFRLCLTSLAVLVAFSTTFVLLTYALAASPWPLANAGLAWWDAKVGCSATAITEWVNARPWLYTVMWYAYFSLLPQTMLLIIVLGFRNSERLTRFLVQFMLCGLVSVACFYFVPAIGSCGATVPDHMQKTVADTLALHEGTAKVVTWRGAEGLLTFPSFHVIWGVLLALAFRWWPITLLNVLMIVSTIPIGTHYGIDLVGGFLVCVFMIPCADRLLDAVKQQSKFDSDPSCNANPRARHAENHATIAATH